MPPFDGRQPKEAASETRRRFLSRWQSLSTERTSWFNHWKELSRFILPRSGRFLSTDRNRGQKKHNDIYDSTGSRSARVLAAGMMAGMTSPARPWFRLATPDKELMEFTPVKIWLDQVAKLMRDVFSTSNTYRSLHGMYGELGVFGTGANIIIPDFDTVVHNERLTAGEYAIAPGPNGKIDTLYREFELPVDQVVRQFGYDNCSNIVKNLYDRAQYAGRDAWVPIMHVIEPRSERDPKRGGPQNMAYKSCYFERDGNEDTLLRTSGFRRFNAVVPRWETEGGDIYGSSPGMEALAPIKELQHMKLRRSQATDYQVKPPLQMPSALKNKPHSTLPGGVAFFDSTGPQNSIKSMFDVNINQQHLLESVRDTRDEVRSLFYVDLFLFLQTMDQNLGATSRQITAREIAERHEEKLIMLGPVLERLHDELLKPLIDITFDRLLEAGVLPNPPEELSGQDLEVEFISMLAQAQRAVGIGNIERLMGTIQAIGAMEIEAGRPQATALDKFDIDQSIDKVSDMLGVDPDLVVADDKVAIVRDERAQALQAQQAMATAQQAAAAAKDASAAKLDAEEPSALTELTGYSGGGSGL